MRPDTSIMGALSNAFENFSGSMVADVIISFRSLLLRRSLLRMPRMKSIFALLSCASSIIRVSYLFRQGSDCVSMRRTPSVISFMWIFLFVLSLKRIL